MANWDDVAKNCQPNTPAARFVALCRNSPNADLYLDLFKAMVPRAQSTPQPADVRADQPLAES